MVTWENVQLQTNMWCRTAAIWFWTHDDSVRGKDANLGQMMLYDVMEGALCLCQEMGVEGEWAYSWYKCLLMLSFTLMSKWNRNQKLYQSFINLSMAWVTCLLNQFIISEYYNIPSTFWSVWNVQFLKHSETNSHSLQLLRSGGTKKWAIKFWQ